MDVLLTFLRRTFGLPLRGAVTVHSFDIADAFVKILRFVLPIDFVFVAGSVKSTTSVTVLFPTLQKGASL